MLRLKKVFALLALTAFLFPFVEKEIHNFSHKNDFHCNSKVTHIHEFEHHCNVCDFTNDVNGTPALPESGLKSYEIADFLFPFSENHLSLHRPDFLSLRAPPVVF